MSDYSTKEENSVTEYCNLHMPISPKSHYENNSLVINRISPIAPEQIIIMVLAAAFLMLATLSGISRLVSLPEFITKLLDVETEVNLWTWANVLILAYAALAHMACAATQYFGKLKNGLYWFISGSVIAALSLDDFVQLHEQTQFIGEILGGGEGITRNAWVIPGLAIGILCVAALSPVMIKADPVPGRLMIFGTGFFFIGAIGFDAISGYLLSRWGHDYIYDIVVHTEEMLEALGAILFLGAALAELRGQKAVVIDLVTSKFD